MEVEDKLKELNMTVDEIDRLTKAFKDDKFKEMLRNYAHELSDPENKKRYEEEIKVLEQERGNTIQFIHPEPFRALRTSLNGKQKCFINICSNDQVGKPECKWGVSEEGRRGQCWSLPHSLHPGRQDTDPKGNKIMIYDVIFHPDTLHIASKNKRFTDMVDSTAIQGIQDNFKVTLDKNNIREMKTKYKGAPQPCVIRKPIPGHKTKEPAEEPDPLAFPYPGEKRPSLQTKPTESPASKNSSDATPKSIQPQKAKESTKPNHTVKYRFFTDLQDFRCSRDSAQSPRPKEIVVTIDMPLLKAATDASLDVKESRLLLLESNEPAYRLELPLAYPVDEDKGEAKFNKQRGQLTVTLPVLPSNEAFDFAVGPAQPVSDDERQEEKSELEEEEKWKERESNNNEEEAQRGVDEDFRQQIREEEVEKEGGRGQEKGEERMREGQEGVAGERDIWRKQKREGENSEEEEEEIGMEEAKWKEQKRKGQEGVGEDTLKEQKQESVKEVGDFNLQKRQQHEDKKHPGPTRFQSDAVDFSTEEENSLPEHSSCLGKEGEVNLNLNSDVIEQPVKTKESVHGNEKVETDAAFLDYRSSGESQTSIAANTLNKIKSCCISRESSKMPATAEADSSSEKRETLLPEPSPLDLGENVDEDDLPTEQIFHSPEPDDKPPPAILREIDKDGNETIISDHSTSAEFVFQNSLMYELD